jgi:hypothetical protein
VYALKIPLQMRQMNCFDGFDMFHQVRNALEHQIVHLELPAMHEPLMIAPECLMVLCILDSCLPSSFVDKVDVIISELVLRGFIICLDVEVAHGELRG